MLRGFESHALRSYVSGEVPDRATLLLRSDRFDRPQWTRIGHNCRRTVVIEAGRKRVQVVVEEVCVDVEGHRR